MNPSAVTRQGRQGQGGVIGHVERLVARPRVALPATMEVGRYHPMGVDQSFAQAAPLPRRTGGAMEHEHRITGAGLGAMDVAGGRLVGNSADSLITRHVIGPAERRRNRTQSI